MTNCTCPGRNPTRPPNVPCDADMMYVAGSQIKPGDWLVMDDLEACLVVGVVAYTGRVSIAVTGRKPFTEASCANRVVYRRPEPAFVPACAPLPPVCGCETQRDLVPREHLAQAIADKRVIADKLAAARADLKCAVEARRTVQDRAERAEAKLAALRAALSDI